jgi:two-component system OmpR family sensor kinase
MIGAAALRDRLRRTTLRSRVLAVVLVALLISCTTVALVTTVALHGFLQDRLDQQLESANRRNVGQAGRLIGPNRPPDTGRPGLAAIGLVIGQPVGTIGAEVTDGQVAAFNVVGHSGDYSASYPVIAALQPSGGPTTRTLAGLGSYRLLAVPGPNGSTLVTGLPESNVSDTVGHLLLVEVTVFAAALVVTGLGAAASVRLSLRPLTRVAQTAEQVSAMPLASGDVHLPPPVPNPAPGTEAGKVADAVNRMLAHVQNALRHRHASEDRLRRFVADASHELRTPVAIIRSHAEFAERAGGGELAPDVARALERIRVQSDRMTGLVEDLLLLARLDAGRPLAREPVDLTRLVLDAVRDAQVAVPDHGWQLDLPDEPVTVCGDEPTLHQSVGNLLANAGRHTPAGTTITVSLRRVAGAVLVDVADDGPGIAPDVQPRLFERFVHGGTGPGSGYGLGLPIVAAIVHAHAGRVELFGNPGATLFRIVLPGSSALPASSALPGS